MTADQLLHMARSEDAAGLAAALIDLNERQRRAAAEQLQSAMKMPFRPPTPPSTAFHETAQVALFGTAIRSEVTFPLGFNWFGLYPPVIDVLAARPERTVAAIGREIVNSEFSTFWPVARGMVERGLLEPPDDETMALCFVRSLRTAVLVHLGDDETSGDRLRAVLDRDPSLVEVFWSALRFESVAMLLDWGDWDAAWAAAVDGGQLDRGRSLDEALDGLTRDFRPGATRLFRSTWEALAPSTGDAAARVDRLLRALAAGSSTDQAFVTKILLALVKAGHELDGHAVAPAVEGVLGGTAKGAAMSALRLLERVELPDVERARAALPALGHAHADVQGGALRLIQAGVHGLDADERTALGGWVAAVAPEHRQPLRELAGDGAEAAVDGDVATAPAASIADLEARIAALPDDVTQHFGLDHAVELVRTGHAPAPVRLTPALRGDPVSPVASGDELAETLIVLLSGTGDPIDVERAIDGLARIDPTAMTSAQLSAVLRLVPDHANRSGWATDSTSFVFSVAAMHWCHGRQPGRLPYLAPARKLFGAPEVSHELTPAPRSTATWRVPAFDGSEWPAGCYGMLATRVWEAVTIGVSSPRPTLALPSTTDGWIVSDDLVERIDVLRRRRVSPARFEAVQALLRLDPGDRPTVDPGRGAVADGVRTVVAGGRPPRDEGLAQACRPAVAVPEQLVIEESEPHRSETWTYARFADATTATGLRRDDLVGVLVDDLRRPAPEAGPRNYWTSTHRTLQVDDRLLCAWARLLAPRHRALVHAVAMTIAVDHVDADRSSDALDEVVAPLSDQDEPLGWHAHALVAAALSSNNEILGTAAVDVVAAAAIDGRLDPAALGGVLARLTDGGVARLTRVGRRLSAIAGDGPLLADQVRRVGVAWIAALDALPRDAHAVLGLLDLACAESGGGVDDVAARRLLETGSTGSSKRAQLARRLLSLEPSAGPTADLLVAVVARAERSAARRG
ncbi:MAG: hypothetical protein QNJ12_17950 [Ilumatobacter sp.]|uniref:hypothetical protein n=1 Tax=Ilumatobacter sp. TaxID=1967498 RepID=UPI00262E2C8F|nr:hypothetical protein [Ilumatobacter sp.]MDJ0770682.1 hypothetical protein [Ilumatobacter sp.]